MLAATLAAILPGHLADATRSQTPWTKAQFGCGFAPFPPFGCRVGPCVCDQAGQNCQWQIICGR
tara:strand:+ start:116 stop:307 length:192 start_codon:yes stop_codon:yes gene_type:complete